MEQSHEKKQWTKQNKNWNIHENDFCHLIPSLKILRQTKKTDSLATANNAMQAKLKHVVCLSLSSIGDGGEAEGSNIEKST